MHAAKYFDAENEMTMELADQLEQSVNILNVYRGANTADFIRMGELWDAENVRRTQEHESALRALKGEKPRATRKDKGTVRGPRLVGGAE